MISKIYWEFWHSIFKNALESSYNFITIEMETNGTFSLLETSVSGNITCAYIMMFHYDVSPYHRNCSPHSIFSCCVTQGQKTLQVAIDNLFYKYYVLVLVCPKVRILYKQQ